MVISKACSLKFLSLASIEKTKNSVMGSVRVNYRFLGVSVISSFQTDHPSIQLLMSQINSSIDLIELAATSSYVGQHWNGGQHVFTAAGLLLVMMC